MDNYIKKVISGGQTGADMAGIVAANKSGILTGGTAPKDFMTERGPEPRLARYGLVAAENGSYLDRTRKNIEDSDGTLILAGNFTSPGTRATADLCRTLAKPYYPISVKLGLNPSSAADWLRTCGIRVVNIAGNRESVCPGIAKTSLHFLMEVFQLLRERTDDGTSDSGTRDSSVQLRDGSA